jgi:translation initiation factor 3 subunit I
MADDGERMGTYNGHLGTVWDLDPSWCSTFLITAGADQKVMLWEVETGDDLLTYEHGGPVRSVAFNEIANKFVSCNDNFSDNPPSINIYEFNSTDPMSSSREPLKQFKLEMSCKATRVCWVNYRNQLDGGILVTLEDGRIQILDPETGDVLEEEKVHSKQVKRISMNKDKTLLFTASEDCTGKMLDADTLETLITYETDRPVNAIVPHPTKDHVLLGGGQDAMSVTTTSGRVGKFECRFFERIYNTEIGRVKGHFGPINAIAINPDGRSYASGAEDGYIRLHHFDQAYIEMKDPVPEEEIKDGKGDNSTELGRA